MLIGMARVSVNVRDIECDPCDLGFVFCGKVCDSENRYRVMFCSVCGAPSATLECTQCHTRGRPVPH